MKPRIRMPVYLAVCAAVWLSACATFEGTAYRTLGTTASTVEAARKGWVDYVTQQRLLLPPESKQRLELEQQVQQSVVVYAQYQQAMRTAKAAVLAYKTSPTNEVAAEKALRAVEASAGQLVGLINMFIAKPN